MKMDSPNIDECDIRPSICVKIYSPSIYTNRKFFKYKINGLYYKNNIDSILSKNRLNDVYPIIKEANAAIYIE